jgi:hypothetical protein
MLKKLRQIETFRLTDLDSKDKDKNKKIIFLNTVLLRIIIIIIKNNTKPT